MEYIKVEPGIPKLVVIQALNNYKEDIKETISKGSGKNVSLINPAFLLKTTEELLNNLEEN